MAAIIECIDWMQSVLVCGHITSNAAKFVIACALSNKQRIVYTIPVGMQSSHRQYDEFNCEFKDHTVGLITDETVVNPLASCLIVTTETLRNILYRGRVFLCDVNWVVDAISIGDGGGGGECLPAVWQQALMLLPTTNGGGPPYTVRFYHLPFSHRMHAIYVQTLRVCISKIVIRLSLLVRQIHCRHRRRRRRHTHVTFAQINCLHIAARWNDTCARTPATVHSNATCVQDLFYHAEVHIGAFPFHCRICLQRSNENSARTVHEANCHIRCRYECYVCRKSFGSIKCELITHMRVHSGTRPFSCTKCPKHFTSTANLHRHIEGHNGPPRRGSFHCDRCDRRYTRKWSLTRHQNTTKNHTYH